ncbi:hypothetical protein BXZ70DRAFT_930276 [Cristinia sonorae]|uniref:Uncharacterized protein n=1 Tax=Cristinia sonorae TaxID=1940300 RepID=A0A8K0URZ0_9AGAR|nr:hypothetical protein BXZ70DRAFT_930276 [Cristinia sonorae]
MTRFSGVVDLRVSIFILLFAPSMTLWKVFCFVLHGLAPMVQIYTTESQQLQGNVYGTIILLYASFLWSRNQALLPHTKHSDAVSEE